MIHPPSWSGELHEGRPDLRRVVTLGSFHPDKRQLDQVEVARSLPDRNFVLLGNPAAPRYAQKVKDAASHVPNVEVVLGPTRQRIDIEFARASHFLHMNPLEGFGIATVEAVAGGCIPVVPNAGGVREIVEPPELRFTSIADCVEALRGSTGDAGRRLLEVVQRRLSRFDAAGFRSAMLGVIGAQESRPAA